LYFQTKLSLLYIAAGKKGKGTIITVSGMALWLTGLPGSGKSTVADEIKKRHSSFVLLRMDELRKVITPQPTYSETEREIVYRAIVYLAKKLTESGHDVIIDATGNLRRWRDLARQLIARYGEVYLQCPIAACIRREQERVETREAPKDIYRKGAAGWPVPGVSVPYEEPLRPELVIETDKVQLEDIVKKVDELIEKM
jgi:adenylylsulfate kinase